MRCRTIPTSWRRICRHWRGLQQDRMEARSISMDLQADSCSRSSRFGRSASTRTRFQPSTTSPFATSNPSYDSTQYSASFGGPIGKKTSFFLNFERRNIGDNAVVNAFVLDPTTFQQTPYNTSLSTPRTRTNVGGRLDFQLTKNNTLSARYQYWQDNQDNNGVGQFSLPTQAYNNNNS